MAQPPRNRLAGPWNLPGSRVRNYPGLQAGEQHSVPSQEVPPPQGGGRNAVETFVPNIQPDMIQNARVADIVNPIIQAGVRSTFDALPLQAVEFAAFSGGNMGGSAHPDTGVIYNLTNKVASLFYLVPTSKLFIIRNWKIDAAVAITIAGALPGTSVIVDGTLNASNFFARLDFIVDGVFQDSETNLILGDLPFGSMGGECYIIAGPQQLIEMRLTALGANPAVVDPEARISQGLMAFEGDALLDNGAPWLLQPGANQQTSSNPRGNS